MKKSIARAGKRLRVVWAAMSQQWHEHQCADCASRWFCQAKGCDLQSGVCCQSCENEQLAKWVTLKEQTLNTRVGRAW